MPEISTSGSMSGAGKRGHDKSELGAAAKALAIATARLFDSTSMPVVGAVRTNQSIGGPVQLALGLWDRYDAPHA